MIKKYSVRLKTISDLKKQLIKFSFIGGLAVLTDLLIYFILLNLLPEKVFNFIGNEAFAKTISFMCGTFVTYNFNKFWTWKQKDRSNKRFVKFMLLYGISLIVNVGLNSTFLYLMNNYEYIFDVSHKYLFAFVGASVISATVNFLGQKIWVFKKKEILL